MEPGVTLAEEFFTTGIASGAFGILFVVVAAIFALRKDPSA